MIQGGVPHFSAQTNTLYQAGIVGTGFSNASLIPFRSEGLPHHHWPLVVAILRCQ